MGLFKNIAGSPLNIHSGDKDIEGNNYNCFFIDLKQIFSKLKAAVRDLFPWGKKI
jgi:hypothetical protein